MQEMRSISREELSKHNKEDDCWIAIDGRVYDVTKFLRVHPAGKNVILSISGKDVTESFYAFHKKEVLSKYGPKLCVGVLEGTEVVEAVPSGTFDVHTPFAESSFVRGWSSAYMNESHKRFRAECRRILAEHVGPHVDRLHERGEDPSEEMFETLGKAGMLAARCGPAAMPFVKKLGLKLPGGVSPDEFNYFHEIIAIDEFYRLGSSGVSDGLGTGATIGLPPVLLFGRRKMKERIVPEVLLGKKRACLAITEPITGSDVANITTTAVLNAEGTHYVVNGIKKWITGSGSTFPTVYTTAVRTGGPGHKGISLLLIEDPADASGGVITKHRIKTSYSGAAGTALLVFENVLVPRENLLGAEGSGFKLIVANFNHERWYIACITAACGRVALGECYRWAMQRRAFGKRLVDQPVVRYKLAELSAIAESIEAWLDSLTFQMCSMTPFEAFEKLSPSIALLKFQCTRFGVKFVDNACQIFGGRAVTRTGMGRLIETFKNEAKFAAILGGSEEIVADLAVRQAVAQWDSSQEGKMMSRL